MYHDGDLDQPEPSWTIENMFLECSTNKNSAKLNGCRVGKDGTMTGVNELVKTFNWNAQHTNKRRIEIRTLLTCLRESISVAEDPLG